ncbi:nephrin [Oryzias latipes]|uniref:nephrin n=1 Tax=Oryzias latipes TaxID=8090 RepID=UPI0009DAFC3B|nr:nephrin [Oryzias latipes]
MEFLSAWIVSPSTLPFLCLIWGAQAQQAFRIEPRNLTVRMGATAVLKCEVLRASGTVQWVKDGLLLGPQRSLPGFPRYSMIGKRGQYHLRIENAQLEDDTFYECQAGQSDTSEGIISNAVWLDVLIPPSNPYFTMDMAAYWVAGESYDVTCVAPDAKPEAEVILYKDGVKLTGVESSSVSGSKDKLLNTLAEVTVTALSSDNGRLLACHAKNAALSKPVVTTVTMNVYYPPDAPFIVNLDRDEVRAGRMLMLECVSGSGNPLAALRWSKNGEIVSTTWEADEFARKSRSVLKMVITPADNQAELSCESFNAVSLSPLSITRKLDVFFDPEELTLSGSLEAIEGQEVVLSCFAASSNPPVDIRWWLGYKELNNTVFIREEGDNGGMTTVSNVTYRFSREDNGLMLNCEAFNKGTRFSKIKDAKISVYYPPQKVWLDAPAQDVPLNAGTKVTLICHSTGGNPTPTLTWLKNGKAVAHAPKQTSSDMAAARELHLVLTPSDNMATYRCDATNNAKKTISAHAKLLVYFTAVSMKITAHQEVLRQGEVLTLECLAESSNPTANIFWSVGAVRFQKAEQTHSKDKSGAVTVNSTLLLNLTSQHHKQNVICQAYNPVLEEGANTYYRLNVLHPPEFSSAQPTEIQVEEDEMATIPLLVSANPEGVSCVWLHRRETLVKGNNLHHYWLEDGSLEIRNATRRDAGLYTIKCENEEGVSQTAITLDVLYACDVTAEKDPVFVNLGGTADLICVADANPIISDMFSWKWLGEEEVEMGEETQEDESSLLTIRNVTRAHSGLYQCTANNGIGLSGSVNMQLVVQFKPELQKGPQWRKVASRGDGSTTAELVCRAEGIPRIDFSWEKKGVFLDLANPRYEEKTVREGSFHTSTLRVVNVSAVMDYAVFSCYARNSLGEDKVDIQLVSTNHPDPPSMFRHVSSTHDSVTLEWIPGFNGGLQQKFRIRYQWDQSVSFQYVDVFPPDATTFTVTGLQPVTVYNFSINALNAIGESDYADNNAVLTITTMYRPGSDEDTPPEEPQSPSELPAYMTAVFTFVIGIVLMVNVLGCFLGLRWKKKCDQRGAGGGSVVDGQKSELDGSSQSSERNSNKYESGEKINTAAQRTLLIDSGSETESHVYETCATDDSHYYYHPTIEYRPSLRPVPEERRGLGVHDVSHLPVNPDNHVYEDVMETGMFRDTVGPSLPFPDHRLTQQRSNWRSATYHQGFNRGQSVDVQAQRDLPFELRGELV